MPSRNNRRPILTPQSILNRAEKATKRAYLKIVEDNIDRTKIRGLPVGSQVSPAPWYAMMSFAGPEYREVAFASNSSVAIPRDNWGNYFERCLRYDVFWSHYEGNVYKKMHQWAEALKQDNGLYDYVRTIFSPAYRICEFWGSHIMGGQLDPDAGDGKVKPSAIPIEIPRDNPKADAIRRLIAMIWRDSTWGVSKDTYPLYGSVLGDVGLMVIDDASRQKVYIRIIHPRTLMDVTRDPFGNVKGYILSEPRLDPRNPDPFIRLWVTYTEVAARVGDEIEFTTYLDNEPYDWHDYPDDVAEDDIVGPVYREKYGFIPLVVIPNRDNGQGWGWSDLQPDISKLYELDDIASKVSDQVRKIVDAFWFVTGAAPGDLDVNYGDADWDQPKVGTTDDGQGKREKQPIIYGPTGASMQPMIAPLDIAEASAHIQSIAKTIEDDHPELASENVSADASGEARRVARQRAEAMVRHRRSAYDNGMVRILQMAISIGAMKGYPGFEDFTAESYENDELNFSIGDRPVFAVTNADRMADAQAQATIIQTFLSAGLPMRSSLRLAGLPDQTIDLIMKDAREESETNTADEVKQQQSFFPDEPVPGDEETPGTEPEASPKDVPDEIPAGGPGEETAMG